MVSVEATHGSYWRQKVAIDKTEMNEQLCSKKALYKKNKWGALYMCLGSH